MAVPRERQEQLLRALEAEPPLDDREAEDVEPAGGGNGGAGRTLGGFVAQKPYLATTSPAPYGPAGIESALRASRRPQGAGMSKSTSWISIAGAPPRFSTKSYMRFQTASTSGGALSGVS